MLAFSNCWLKSWRQTHIAIFESIRVIEFTFLIEVNAHNISLYVLKEVEFVLKTYLPGFLYKSWMLLKQWVHAVLYEWNVSGVNVNLRQWRILHIGAHKLTTTAGRMAWPVFSTIIKTRHALCNSPGSSECGVVLQKIQSLGRLHLYHVFETS